MNCLGHQSKVSLEQSWSFADTWIKCGTKQADFPNDGCQKIQMLNTLVWIIQLWCGTASWKLIWFLLGYRSCPHVGFKRQKKLRFRILNRCGTSGNAMEIFSICGRVAALGYTYFRILRVCLSIFLASVLVRVLHPCVALALWKLLRGCSCCVLIWWTHLTDGMLFVCLCTSLLWSGSLVLPFPAAAWMKVECISQAICSRTCVWKVEREKHLRITQCGMSIHIWWTHLTDGMLFVCLCTSLLWSGSLVLPFPTAAWMKVECISEAICYLRMEVRAWKASQDYSMWNDHSQNSSWNQSLLCLALELNFLVIVPLSFRLSFGATKK